MRTPHVLAGLTLALALTLSACGSDDDTTGIDPVAVGGTSTPSATASAGSDGLDDTRDFGDDTPLTGDVLDRASAAALAAVEGDGTVTEATGADAEDDHVYEVEITLADGEDVDVELDRDFGVVDIDR